jgi:ankyrin repeat protein
MTINERKVESEAKNTVPEIYRDNYFHYMVMRQPVIASDGHTYEKECIEHWFYEGKRTSPYHGGSLNKNYSLRTNFDLTRAIEEFLENNQQLFNDGEIYLPNAWKSAFAKAIQESNINEIKEYARKDRRLLTINFENNLSNHNAFSLACQQGNIDIINCLISLKGDKDACKKLLINQNDQKCTPLHYIFYSEIYAVVKLTLLRKLISQFNLVAEDLQILGKSQQSSNNQLNECFQNSINECFLLAEDSKLIKMLSSLGADINAQDKIGNTLLARKTLQNDKSCVEALICLGAKPNINNHHKQTPLMYAVTQNDGYITKCLLDSKANTKLRDIQGKTVLHYACESGNLEAVKQLVAYDKDLVEVVDNEQETSLFRAVQKDKKDIIFYLLNKNANPNARNKYSQMPLHFAQSKEVTESLITKNANIDARDNKLGNTPLIAAIEAEKNEVAIALVKSGAEIEEKNHEGDTALMVAAYKNNENVLKFLLKSGAEYINPASIDKNFLQQLKESGKSYIANFIAREATCIRQRLAKNNDLLEAAILKQAKQIAALEEQIKVLQELILKASESVRTSHNRSDQQDSWRPKFF